LNLAGSRQRNAAALLPGFGNSRNFETFVDWNFLVRRFLQAADFGRMPNARKRLGALEEAAVGGIDSKVMSEDEMWRKFDRIVETAEQVWK
jgi:hypothetical protein